MRRRGALRALHLREHGAAARGAARPRRRADPRPAPRLDAALPPGLRTTALHLQPSFTFIPKARHTSTTPEIRFCALEVCALRTPLYWVAHLPEVFGPLLAGATLRPVGAEDLPTARGLTHVQVRRRRL